MDGKTLTIAYVTARREPKTEWFFQSLENESAQHGQPEAVIVVDHYFPRGPIGCEKFLLDVGAVKHVAPKPNVWNGPHRLPKDEWWAMSSALNTAICLCQTTHIAFVDDISVLLPGWLDAAHEAMDGGYIACGAYRKVKNLVVENGSVVSFDAFPEGEDHRLARVTEDVSSCSPGWLFGCSCLFPLEDLLEVGGFPEYADGLGSQDYLLGIALANNGKHLKYCRKMMTLESEELHHYTVGSDHTWEEGVRISASMKRANKGPIGTRNDKSWAALRIAQGSKYFPNYYEGGIRALRNHVLAGNPFPIVQIPTHDWYDGQMIAEMV